MFIIYPKSNAIALNSALPSIYILGLSKEILNFHLSPGAAKLWALKVCGQKEPKKQCRGIPAFESLM